ncbi:S-methyl-5-thioribose-1-phosphate isomerase [Candidatus Bathyarchaeota archaeon]|nr:S-methyl-5-thioribose-1-phosphate isomerase [Candidatus Bathyarchaeota archaeon]
MHAIVKKTIHEMEIGKITGASNVARASVKAIKEIAEQTPFQSEEQFLEEIKSAAKTFVDYRPSMASVKNGVAFILCDLLKGVGEGLALAELRNMVIKRAEWFIKESLEAVEKIGEFGSRKLSDGDLILTHSLSSTTLEIFKRARMAGKAFSVIVTESRPGLEGHITASELSKFDIPVTLIIDSAAGYMLKGVNAVIVGADSVLADGSIINKVGTYLVALAAKDQSVSFWVATETFKINPSSPSIQPVIEEGSPSEVIDLNRFKNLKVRNPYFDITPPKYVTGVITEEGILEPQAINMVAQKLPCLPVNF